MPLVNDVPVILIIQIVGKVSAGARRTKHRHKTRVVAALLHINSAIYNQDQEEWTRTLQGKELLTQSFHEDDEKTKVKFLMAAWLLGQNMNCFPHGRQMDQLVLCLTTKTHALRLLSVSMNYQWHKPCQSHFCPHAISSHHQAQSTESVRIDGLHLLYSSSVPMLYHWRSMQHTALTLRLTHHHYNHHRHR